MSQRSLPSTVRNHAPGRPGAIDNSRLREAYLDAVATGRARPVDVARAMGWEGGGKPDTGRARRALGITPHTSTFRGRRSRSLQASVDAGVAARLAHAIGLDPREVGA